MQIFVPDYKIKNKILQKNRQKQHLLVKQDKKRIQI